MNQLTTEELIARIHTEFPQFSYKEVKRIDNGWDHIVLIFDGLWVFRFARNSEDGRVLRFKQELRILQALKHKVVVNLPEYIYVSKTSLFGGHHYLRGAPLTAQRFALLGENRTQEILRNMSQFLKELHALPLSLLEPWKDGVFTKWTPAEYYDRFVNERRAILEKFVDANLLARADSFQKAFVTHAIPRTVITHSDLRDAHILLARGGFVPSVIDFGEAQLGDPAEDISYFWFYGNDAAAETVREYGGDSVLLERSHWHFVRYLIDQLYYANRGRDAGYLGFVEEMLDIHLRELGF